MPIRVNLPDGSVANFPDGMSPGDIEKALSAGPSAPTPTEAAAPTAQADAPYRDPRGILGEKVMNFGRGVLHTISQHPVESAATAGAMLAVPFTGGTSLLPMAAAAGLGGAGGAGVGLLAKAGRGDADTPNTAGDVLATMGKQGAVQGATELAGGAVGKGLAAAGRGLYRAAVRPAARLTEKYGDLVGAGLSEAVPVGGSKVVQGRMLTSKTAADQLVSEAQAAGRSVPTTAVTGKFNPLVDKAMTREALGNGAADFNEIAAREGAFNAAHPTGQIAPTRAMELKREADALAATAQNAVRRGSATNDMTGLLHDATRSGLKEGLEGVAPGLADVNARTSTLYGLSHALRSAETRPHGLTDLATVASFLGGAASGDNTAERTVRGAAGAGLMRAATAPWVQSQAGIAAFKGSKLPYAALVRLALLAAMSGSGPDEDR